MNKIYNFLAENMQNPFLVLLGIFIPKMKPPFIICLKFNMYTSNIVSITKLSFANLRVKKKWGGGGVPCDTLKGHLIGHRHMDN